MRIARAILILGILASARPGQAEVEEHDLIVGQDLTFHLVREFAIENHQVLKSHISDGGHTLVLHAVQPGLSKVLLRFRGEKELTHTLDISVGLRDPRQVLRELEQELRGRDELHMHIQRNQIFLEGSVKSSDDIRVLHDLERKYEGQLSIKITAQPAAQKPEVMIRLDLHYVQVRRQYSRNLGIRYPASISGGALFGAFSPPNPVDPSAQAALIQSLMPSLDVSETSGFIKVLRSDSLITENEGKAVYRNGTELPVRLTGTLGAGTIEKMFFGAELTVTPRLSPTKDSVSLVLSAVVSARDDATQDGLPGKTLDAINTTVHVPMGQSVMLSGVNLRSSARSSTGIPGLRSIPILGYLFGSESKEDESALVIIYITPTLIQETAAQFQPLIDKALRCFENPSLLPK
jgi:pilus assembly protein CpaC